MLEELGKYFDHYTINARFLPAFFSILPFVLTMMAWCPSANSILGGTLTILISFGVMAFISTIISNLGNRRQKLLFASWGGAPTTVILRHRDKTLDKYTKNRYHTWLNEKIDNLNLPCLEDENEDRQNADLKYQSATNFLREFTREKARYPGVYRDNVAYGFARNLLAIRTFGLANAFICVLINFYFAWPIIQANKSNVDGLTDSMLGIGSGFSSIIFFVVFMFVVNGDFVKERGFRYAKTLLESCELNR